MHLYRFVIVFSVCVYAQQDNEIEKSYNTSDKMSSYSSLAW